MSAGTVARSMVRGVFRWKMLFMLIGSTIVFGGVFGAINFKNKAIAEYLANMFASQPAVNVTAAAAEQQDWAVQVPAIGVLEANRGVDINSSVTGLIQQILFESGETVKQGQTLLRLDADVERSNLQSAQASLKLAKANLARGESLRTSDNISKATLEQRQSEYEVASAEVSALVAQIEKKVISAPFDGVLGIRKVNVGGYLDVGKAIVNIQDLSVMLINFSVSQRELSSLKVGQEIDMTTDAYPLATFKGEISTIAPLVNQETGMVEVQGRFDNSHGQLRPGMFAKLNVLLPARKQVIVVPQTAISYSLYGDNIYIIKTTKDDKGQETNLVERKIVKTGERRNGFIIIEEGIAAGDKIVTSGQLKLDNGSKVAISDVNPLATPAEIPTE